MSPRKVHIISDSVATDSGDGRKEPTFATCSHDFINLRRFSARNGILAILNLESTAAVVIVAAIFAQLVHTSLEGVVLPAKEIISMLAMSSSGPVYQLVFVRLRPAVNL